MGKNRAKPPRRKGQMNRFTLRVLNTGPTAQSKQAHVAALPHSSKSVHRVQLEDINGHRRQLVSDPFLDVMFSDTGVVRDPEDYGLFRNKPGVGKGITRLEALRKRAAEIAREFGQEPDRAPLVVYVDRLKRITLHANAQLSRFWFQREIYQLSLIERSVQYSSMAAAKMIFRNGSVDYPHAEVVSS